MAIPYRNTIFISYSHADEKWLKRLLIFLKPYTSDGALTVWADPYIQAGGLWRREIDAALNRARIGLLLVSANFMASDFIRDVEFPALIDAEKRGLLKLVWVPVSASAYGRSALREYQAACDPARPLDSLKGHEWRRRLVELSETLASLAESTDDSRPVARLEVDRPAVATVFLTDADHRTGELHDVPALPPHYVPRTEALDGLRRALLEGRSGVMGITGEPYHLGLHGQGGIGKSVLAAALARDEAVRCAFPDGVFWVTVGQTPDLPRLQASLLVEAGGEPGSFTDVRHGRKLLEGCFSDRAALLVLDDVWDHRHAREFDVLGATSRLLMTTRDGAVLTALGAHAETVRRLPEAAALALLASWAGSGGVPLPGEAYAVARECGYLPLALSVAGAKVCDGVPWEVVLKALEQGRLEFLDHPYSSVFRSMRLSVDALTEDERERYLELAVFPEDERVPESVVFALWKKTAGLDDLAGQDLLAQFQRKALLEILSSTEGRREVALHDLQHDFLRISVHDLAALHGELLAALGAGLAAVARDTAWWALPPGERYPWVHLASHLVAADRGEELRRLLFDCRWLEAKLRAVGLPSVLSDFATLPRDEELLVVAGALRLSGHVLASDPGQLRSQLTGRLLGMNRPGIRTMLQEAAVPESGSWLRPAASSLTPPTGALLRILAGPAAEVRSVAVMPEGHRAVSASEDGTLKVWDLEAGAEERTLTGHGGEVRAVAVTAEGRRAVSASDDRTLKIWDLETGVLERTLAGHTHSVLGVAVTPEGRRAISASEDGTLKVWDLETGAEERNLVGHTDSVVAVAVTPEGRRAVSASQDGTLKVWDLETGAAERTLTGHTASVLAVAVTAEGRRAVSASRDRTVRVWDLETGAEERTFTGHAGAVLAVAVTPNGRRAISASEDGRLKVWDLETGAEERIRADHVGRVNAVAVVAEGNRVVSGSWDGTLKVWDLEADADERTLTGHAGWVNAVAVTPEGRCAVSASWDGTLKVWDLMTGAEERTLEGHAGLVRAVVVTPDGRRAVSASLDGTLKVWNLETGVEERTLAGHTSGVEAVAVTPEGRRAVSASWDGTLKVWDLETGAEEHTLSGHASGVVAVTVTPEGRRAVSASSDHMVKVWNLETGAEERTFAGHAREVLAVAVTPEGRHAVSASWDGTLKVWDLETAAEERTLLGHTSGVLAVAVTPDGRRAVSSSRDGTLRVWDLETGAEERALTGHRGWVPTVMVMPDGQRAVSASEDRTLKVWDVESGRVLATFTADASIDCCAVALVGARLVAGDRLGRVHILVIEGLLPE